MIAGFDLLDFGRELSDAIGVEIDMHRVADVWNSHFAGRRMPDMTMQYRRDHYGVQVTMMTDVSRDPADDRKPDPGVKDVVRLYEVTRDPSERHLVTAVESLARRVDAVWRVDQN